MTFPSTPRSASFKARAEKFCAKLNDGLAAVAFVLAVLVFVSGTYRTIEMLQMTAEDGAAVADVSGLQETPR
jgi:hypothetical protein